MRGTVVRWGNDLALCLPKAVAESADLAEGDELELTVEGGRVVITKAALCTAPIHTLEALMAGYRPEHRHGETGTDGPVRREIW